MELLSISNYVKGMRKRYSMTQLELSQKAGVGLRFVRELEQGKPSLRMDKVNMILDLFGGEMVVRQLNLAEEGRDE
ncbi:MAG: helix-turn-helix transcriptional regulator [Rikenellaceae bacterium]